MMFFAIIFLLAFAVFGNVGSTEVEGKRCYSQYGSFMEKGGNGSSASVWHQRIICTDGLWRDGERVVAHMFETRE